MTIVRGMPWPTVQIDDWNLEPAQEKLADKSEEERKAYWEEQQRLKALHGAAQCCPCGPMMPHDLKGIMEHLMDHEPS